MSFQKKDRKVQSKSGRSFHAGEDQSFAKTLSAAILAEWGETPSARKEVARITRANERTVRNWCEGKNGPSGENLLLLIRHSDAVFETVLGLSGREGLMPVVSMVGLRDRLNEIVRAIDLLQGQ